MPVYNPQQTAVFAVSVDGNGIAIEADVDTGAEVSVLATSLSADIPLTSGEVICNVTKLEGYMAQTCDICIGTQHNTKVHVFNVIY